MVGHFPAVVDYFRDILNVCLVCGACRRDKVLRLSV